METWMAGRGRGRGRGRLHGCLLPGSGSLQLQPATGTGSGHATSGPAPPGEGLCFLWPLEGWLPRAVAALEPPRPCIKGPGGGTRPTHSWQLWEMGNSGVCGSGAPHKVRDSVFSLQAGGEEPGAAHMNADTRQGRPELQAVLPHLGFLLLRARPVFRGRASVWSQPP